MNISLDHARCFCALVDFGGYQAAALNLHKSHSAVVYAVKSFEKQTGLKLLNRSDYRTSLTPAGHRIYQECQVLLSAVSRVAQACTDLSKGWEPSLKLVYDGVLSADPFLEIFRSFKDQKIPTLLEVFSDYLEDVEKTFIESDAQLMISIVPPKSNGLQAVALKPVKMWLVVQRDFELNQKNKKWTMEELKNFNFLTVRAANENLSLGTSELEKISTFHMNHFGLKKSAILQKTGFGWLPEYLIKKELKSGELKPLHWENPNVRELQPYFFHRKKTGLGRAAQMIQNHLRTRI